MNPHVRPHAREHKDKGRRAGGRSNQYHHLYNSHRWRCERATFLKLNPLCAMCKRRGEVSVATEVDHIIPHRGDLEVFWDTGNWQGLCKPDHDSVKAFIEANGYSKEIGDDGWPIDPQHPINVRG